MNTPAQVCIFGEVLFDCFPAGERILGGAPFNVAWHLQALGDRPRFISGVGDDGPGREILAAMKAWGMETADIRIDPRHPTGRVDVQVMNNEPLYEIVPGCAYDFIDASHLRNLPSGAILYHGTLGLRSAPARNALDHLARNPELSVFLDVNLRAPWWQKQEVFHRLQQARWVKLNQDELRVLGFDSGDLRKDMPELQNRFQLEQVILTCGEQGALVCDCRGEFYSAVPGQVPLFVDTVGAGDAFTAIYIHGLLSGWPISRTLDLAQRFACAVIGLRGATTGDRAFYRDFIEIK